MCEGRREGGRDIQGVRLDKAAWTVGGGIANAFFNSLERYSCVALSVTDSDDEEGVVVNQRHCARLGMGLEKAPEEGSGIGALRLVGCERFVRQNPKTDRFPVQRFHHIEFWYVISSSFTPDVRVFPLAFDALDFNALCFQPSRMVASELFMHQLPLRSICVFSFAFEFLNLSAL